MTGFCRALAEVRRIEDELEEEAAKEIRSACREQVGGSDFPVSGARRAP